MYENLICPNCKYALSAPPSQTQVACPRCCTWLELEARCNGVCISCHAAKKAADTGTCASSSPTADNTQAVQIERSKDTKKPGPLKSLIKKVFESHD
jgi:hypothetical protein